MPTILVAKARTWYNVPCVNPVIELVKVPDEVPSVVLVISAMVGFRFISQTNPLDVIVTPPSEVIVPPLMAVVVVIDVADAVADIIAKTGLVSIKPLSSKPFPLLIAPSVLTSVVELTIGLIFPSAVNPQL